MATAPPQDEVQRDGAADARRDAQQGGEKAQRPAPPALARARRLGRQDRDAGLFFQRISCGAPWGSKG